MNKKLIALALASLPVAAMADVTLYGTLNVGNGLKAIWQVETGFNAGNATASTSSGRLANRQTFVGLDGGNLGQIRMGTLNSALKDQFQVDQWQYDGQMTNPLNANNTNTGVNGLSVMTNTNNRLNRAVRYDTANFGGFDANIEYGFGENKNKNTNVGTASNIVALGLNYAIADFGFHYGYQREANPLGQAGANPKAASINYGEIDFRNDAWFAGLAYSQSVGYDWTDSFSGDSSKLTNGQTPAAAGLKSRQAALSVAYTMGAWTPKATIAKGWDQSAQGNNIKDSGYKQYVLGVDYALSKRTTAELAYGRLYAGKGSSLAVNTESTTYSTLALSVMHNF